MVSFRGCRLIHVCALFFCMGCSLYARPVIYEQPRVNFELAVPADVGQSFTPMINGLLTEIDIVAAEFMNTVLVIQESQSGRVLHVQPVHTSGYGWQCIVLSSPVFLCANTTYLFVLKECRLLCHIGSPAPGANGCLVLDGNLIDLAQLAFRMVIR